MYLICLSLLIKCKCVPMLIFEILYILPMDQHSPKDCIILRSYLLYIGRPKVLASNLLPTLIPLSRVSTICFHHVVIKIRHFIFTTGCLPTSTLLETGVGANDCKCSRDQQLNVPSEARRSWK
jgi:hypothetical protein